MGVVVLSAQRMLNRTGEDVHYMDGFRGPPGRALSRAQSVEPRPLKSLLRERLLAERAMVRLLLKPFMLWTLHDASFGWPACRACSHPQLAMWSVHACCGESCMQRGSCETEAHACAPRAGRCWAQS